MPLHEEDLRQLPLHDQAAAITDRANHWQRSLDLVNGPVTRLVLFHLADGQRLLWCAHHLCVDAVSWRILLGDLEEALVAIRHGAEPRLAPASAAFSAWGQFLQQLAASPDVRSEAAHWLQLDAAANLPLDHPLAISPLFASTRHCSVRLGTDDTRALLEQAQQAYGTRINDLLLTALALALARWSGLRRIAVDLEGHGRLQRPGAPDLSRTVGWFTQIHPLELALPAIDDLGACIKAIKEQVRAVPSEGMSYALLRYATPPAVPDRTAPISFNYLGQLDGLERGGLLALAGEDAGESRSRHFRRIRPIDIDAMVLRGEAVFTISYSSEQFFPETIERLGTAYRSALAELITHCCSGVCGYTPSDFPLARLEPGMLDDLAAQYRRSIADIYPLSPMQLGMLFHSLYADRSSAYVEQIHFRIEGELDPARFRAAWQALIARHPILRTVFLSEVSPPVQIVFDQVEANWHIRGLARLERRRARPRAGTAAGAGTRPRFRPRARPADALPSRPAGDGLLAFPVVLPPCPSRRLEHADPVPGAACALRRCQGRSAAAHPVPRLRRLAAATGTTRRRRAIGASIWQVLWRRQRCRSRSCPQPMPKATPKRLSPSMRRQPAKSRGLPAGSGSRSAACCRLPGR